MARKRKGKSRLKMSTGQAKLLDSASGQVSFRYNMKYIYHCEYLVKEWDTQQYRYIERLLKNYFDKSGYLSIFSISKISHYWVNIILRITA